MSNNSFNLDDQPYQRGGYRFASKPSRIIQWVMKYSGGIIQNEKQASWALLVFAAVALVVSIIFAISSGSSQPAQGPVPVDQFVP